MSVYIQPEEGISYQYVIDGAFMLCDKGVAPSKMRASPKILSYGGKCICTIADNIPILNCFDFGLCSLTQQPCKGSIHLLQWIDFKKDFTIDGKQVLLDKSNINCAIGGKISFIQSGQ